LDASKAVVVEEGKSLYARQADLAGVIQSMMKRSDKERGGATRAKKKIKNRRESMSKGLLQENSNSAEGTTDRTSHTLCPHSSLPLAAEILPPSEAGVRVLSQTEAEKVNSEKVPSAL
jgi:hypothetical protein